MPSAGQSAEANLRIAENQLSYTELRAGRRRRHGDSIDPGQVVSAGQKVVEISPTRSARLSSRWPANISSGEARYAREGVAAEPARIAVMGSIRQISPEADSTTGTYEVKVALASPPLEMRLGAVVVGRAETEGPEVISVPSNATTIG